MQRNAVGSVNGQTQELELRITNLQRQLDQKDEDIKKLQAEIDGKDEDIKSLAQTFEHEYELLRKENEKNVLELQKTFKENIEKSRPSVHLTQSNVKPYQIGDDDTQSVNENFTTPNQKYTPKPPIARNSHHKN